MDRARAYLIDASIFIFRAWFSLPDQWHSPRGMPLNAVYGYTRFLFDFLQGQHWPGHCAAAFDESLGSCFRNDIYPGYKASRDYPDEALAWQLRTCREITDLVGLPTFACERYEADDYLATLARLYRERHIPVAILTRDKDLGQILCDTEDYWWDYSADVRLSPPEFRERFGVSPGQFADYLALVGDPVDDIPGVPGVGPKTASALLNIFGDLHALRDNLHRVSSLDVRGAAALEKRLTTHWPEVELSRSLTGLEEHIPGIVLEPEFQLESDRLHLLAQYLDELDLPEHLVKRCEQLGSLAA